ncbi:MAG: CHAT domain-containing tetratricopeptide repeat protein, partial [Pyrinomonadaceae bacterium]
LTHYQEAITLYQAADDRMKTARATALRGQAFQQQGKIEPARAAFLAALDGFRSLSDQFNLGATLYALGQLELNQDRLDLAENYLQESIRVTENVRRGAQVTDLTSSFSATVYDRYELLVECLMRQQAAHPDRGFAAQAFEASELGRGRSLAELLRATDTNLSSRVEPELAQHERSLRQMLRVKAEQQAELLGQSSIDKAALDALKNEQAQLENEYGQVTDQIRQRYPAFGEIVRPVAWTLREIQTQVLSDDQTVLLEYSFGEDQSYVWAVTRTSFASYELPGRAQINQAAQRVYKLLSQEPGANTATELNAASEELSRMILAPLAGQLNKSRIIVVADGALHYIPFQILLGPTDKNGPLVANHEVVDAPSASILGELRNEAARRRAPAKLLAAFGDPIFQLNYAANKDRPGSDQVAQVQGPETDRWRHVLRDIELNGDTFDPSVIKPLFHAEEELTNISKLATGRDLLLASKFSASREQLLRTDLTQFAILHIATHGFLDPKRPENSGLVLSTVDREGKPQNGFVGLQDIYGLNAPVDLVVLSACQTGLGKDVRGEGLIGLTRGFMYAGASTVVASLWKVDDEVTAELMKQFYINMLQKGMTPAAALRGAQNSIRQRPEWSAPYYWAAFTLQGEYREVIRPVQASGFAAQYGKIVVGGVVLVMLLGAAHWVFGRRGRAATV